MKTLNELPTKLSITYDYQKTYDILVNGPVIYKNLVEPAFRVNFGNWFRSRDPDTTISVKSFQEVDGTTSTVLSLKRTKP